MSAEKPTKFKNPRHSHLLEKPLLVLTNFSYFLQNLSFIFYTGLIFGNAWSNIVKSPWDCSRKKANCSNEIYATQLFLILGACFSALGLIFHRGYGFEKYGILGNLVKLCLGNCCQFKGGCSLVVAYVLTSISYLDINIAYLITGAKVDNSARNTPDSLDFTSRNDSPASSLHLKTQKVDKILILLQTEEFLLILSSIEIFCFMLALIFYAIGVDKYASEVRYDFSFTFGILGIIISAFTSLVHLFLIRRYSQIQRFPKLKDFEAKQVWVDDTEASNLEQATSERKSTWRLLFRSILIDVIWLFYKITIFFQLALVFGGDWTDYIDSPWLCQGEECDSLLTCSKAFLILGIIFTVLLNFIQRNYDFVLNFYDEQAIAYWIFLKLKNRKSKKAEGRKKNQIQPIMSQVSDFVSIRSNSRSTTKSSCIISQTPASEDTISNNSSQYSYNIEVITNCSNELQNIEEEEPVFISTKIQKLTQFLPKLVPILILMMIILCQLIAIICYLVRAYEIPYGKFPDFRY